MAGEIQLNSTSFATESGGTITINNATLASAVDLSNHYASTSEVQGTHTTFSGSHSDTATTINLASVSGISAGDYVVGEGIAPGTTVSSVGASSVVISAGLDTDGVGIAGGEPISFYKSTKALSPGLVAGQLCRAWVNFNGTGTVAIRAAYNVSSITDNGGSGGDYTVNFTTAMPDTNYCASAWVGGGSGGDAACSVVQDGYLSTTSLRLQSRDLNTSAAHNTNNMYESSIVMVSIFR
ncbi:MAG: hypothetical protein ACO20I_07875 [bacterium]